MDNGTSATGSQSEPWSIDDLAKAIELLKKQTPKEWLLISPNGTLYRGTADALLPVLAEDYALLEIPMTDDKTTGKEMDVTDYECPHGAPFLALCNEPECVKEMIKIEDEAYCPHGFLAGCPVCSESAPEGNTND